MRWLWNEDNFLNVGLLKVWDIVICNLLFLLCSLPLVTIGPSLTALYHCMLRMVKGNKEDNVRTFFRAFRQNFRQSLVIWLMTLAIAALLYNNSIFLKEMPGVFATILLYVMVIFALFLAIISLYIYPVIAAFEGTIAMQLKNAFVFAGRHFGRTLGMLVLWTFSLAVTVVDVAFQPLYVFCWFFFLFSTLAWICSKMLYKMFRPYLPAEPGEEVWEVYDDGQAYLP